MKMTKVFHEEESGVILYGDENGVIHGTESKELVTTILQIVVLSEVAKGDIHQAANLSKLGIMVCDTYQQHSEEEMTSLVSPKEEIFEILDAAWDAGKFTQVVVHVINRQGDWLEGLREAKDKFLE